MAPDGPPPGARRAPPQLHGQEDRLRDLLPPARREARAHRHARRVDLRRRGVELPAPPPRHHGDADRLEVRREQGRLQDALDRRDGAAPAPEVDDRPLPAARPRRAAGRERVHEPPVLDRVDDLLGERVRALRRRLPDPLPAELPPRVRPPQELLDLVPDRPAQGGGGAAALAALEVRRRHLRHDGPLLVAQLHDRVALHLRDGPRQRLARRLRPQEAVRHGARLEPPHHRGQEVLPLGQLPRGARVGHRAHRQRRPLPRADGRLLERQPARLLVDRAVRDAHGEAVLVPREGHRRREERDDRRRRQRGPSGQGQAARGLPLHARLEGVHGDGVQGQGRGVYRKRRRHRPGHAVVQGGAGR